MAHGPWSIKTRNGHPADEVISALQKAVRRCEADAAVYWAHEANLSGLGAWTWRRLFVITSEDVGLAEPNAPAVIAGLWTMSEVLRANQPKPAAGESVVHPVLQLLQATWYLARLPKNRELADMATLFEVRQHRHEGLEVPDVALDMHTARGRAMGRGALHFEEDSPAGARWVANELEVDHNAWKQRFYEEWVPPTDPAIRGIAAYSIPLVSRPPRDEL